MGYFNAGVGGVYKGTKVMGKGLSKLQKGILQLAYQNYLERAEGKREYNMDAYTSEIYGELFLGVEVKKPCGSQLFGFDMAGSENAYRSAKASISRALARLSERGLVTRFSGYHSNWAGVKLTETGIALAKNNG